MSHVQTEDPTLGNNTTVAENKGARDKKRCLIQAQIRAKGSGQQNCQLANKKISRQKIYMIYIYTYIYIYVSPPVR